MSDYPHEPGFKTSGTSQEAAESMRESAPTLRAMAYRLLQERTLSADEIAALCRVTQFAMRPRVTELFKQGLIEIVGLGRNRSGRAARIYRALRKPEAADK